MLSTKSNAKPVRNFQFEALGTWWQIDTSDGINEDTAKKVRETIDKVDLTWSRFRDDSTVAQMAEQAGEYRLGEADYGLLAWYQSLYEATDGQVTPLIGQALSDTGYDKNYSLKSREQITKTPSWDWVIELNPGHLTIKQPWLIDVGAAGKGFAVDQVAKVLKPTHDSFTIDGGGDIYCHDHTETIGLENPFDSSKIIGTIRLKDASLCGSAINRRSWGNWHHVINPKTSKPTHGIVATWAVAETAMQADGLATALFFTEPAKLTHLGDFSYVIVHADGQISYSKHNQIEIFK